MTKQLLASLGSVALSFLLVGCGQPAATPAPQTSLILPTLQAIPTQGTDTLSNGGGEPRSAAYWLLWNSCAPDNQSDAAAANGGRSAGWIILDDLLQDPGMLLGDLQVETCQQGIHLLQFSDFQGKDHADDPTYQLASQLLTAQLNLAAGAETCPAADKHVQLGQLLLLDLSFSGEGDYFDAIAGKDAGEAASFLIEQLASYNAGSMCR